MNSVKSNNQVYKLNTGLHIRQASVCWSFLCNEVIFPLDTINLILHVYYDILLNCFIGGT